MIKIFSFFVFLLLSGCGQAQELYSSVYVNEYHDLIGKSLPDLRAIFGVENVKSYSLSGHDPESELPAFKITRGNKTFFITGRDGVESLLFQDHVFKTKQGAQISQGYCDVISVYPGVKFYFGFEEGGVLQLRLEAEKTVLNFDTSNLPIGQYVTKGLPSIDDRSLCSSRVIGIELY